MSATCHVFVCSNECVLHALTGRVRRQSNAERESGMDKVGHVAQQD